MGSSGDENKWYNKPFVAPLIICLIAVILYCQTKNITCIYLAALIIVFWLIILRYNYKDETDKREKLEAEKLLLQSKEKELIKKNKEQEHEIEKKNNQIIQCKEALNTTSPFRYVSTVVADLIDAVFENTQYYLQHKRIPSQRGFEVVKELKAEYRKILQDNLQLKYKYEYLLSIFPELSLYVEDEDEEALLSLGEADDISVFQEEYDHARDYLSLEEYNNLSEDARNQLALDRYKERRRTSSWVAGVEYEMYISYCLRSKGYKVIEFGVEKGLEDLGRDIIATKDEFTYIIQCKRYGEHIEVHENTICQLYGTTLHYILTKKQEDLFGADHVIPVLYTTGRLSDVAKEFSLRLDVRVCIVPMGDYPMIKCNVNQGNKIYHLPFDQQYWRTKIEKPGEFYAVTVKEATSKGFRRAYRYHFNSN